MKRRLKMSHYKRRVSLHEAPTKYPGKRKVSFEFSNFSLQIPVAARSFMTIRGIRTTISYGSHGNVSVTVVERLI